MLTGATAWHSSTKSAAGRWQGSGSLQGQAGNAWKPDDPPLQEHSILAPQRALSSTGVLRSLCYFRKAEGV